MNIVLGSVMVYESGPETWYQLAAAIIVVATAPVKTLLDVALNLAPAGVFALAADRVGRLAVDARVRMSEFCPASGWAASYQRSPVCLPCGPFWGSCPNFGLNVAPKRKRR